MLNLTLALALLGAQAAATTQPATGWIFRGSTDPTKPKSATAAVRIADGSRLLFRCDTVATPIVSVQFLPKPPVAAGDSRTVTLTVDESAADMTSWQFPGTGAYNGETAEVFLIAEEVAKAKTVRVGFAEGDAVIERTFPGPGSDALFRQVYATCGLPYALNPAPPAKKP